MTLVGAVVTVVGQLIPFVGELLSSHAVTRDTSTTMYLPQLYGTAGPLLSLGLTIAGIAATAWMIQSTTIIGSGSGPRYELYGKAWRERMGIVEALVAPADSVEHVHELASLGEGRHV